MEKILDFENAKMIFRNFSGRGSMFNAEGTRNFCLPISREKATILEREGWKVKWPKDPESDRDPYIPVAVRFFGTPDQEDGRDPRIFVRNSAHDQFVKYTENMVGNLDNAEIDTCDIVIRPRQWEMNGKTGIKAYLKSMYVTLMQDDFYGKYFPSDPADYEAPFEE